MKCKLSWMLALCIFPIEASFATVEVPVLPDWDRIGMAGIDASSFLYQSTNRTTSSTTIQAAIHGKYDSKNFHTQGDLQAYAFLTEPQAAVESQEAYISTQKNLLGNHELTLGRRYQEWSKLDHVWDMMSLWSPRFTWDELHPETIGMTGFFYNYSSRDIQWTVFGSFLRVPERGTPTSLKNGTIASPNPFWNPLPTTVTINGNPTPVVYSLSTPPLKEILFKGSLAVREKWQLPSGFWESINWGLLPVNMVQMAAEPFIQGSNLDVNIRPQFAMRSIYTVEGGFDAPSKDWDLWFSASREKPFQYQNQSNWLNPIIVPATIVSAGTNVQLTSNFWFNGSALFIHEDAFTHAGDLPNVNLQLPSRFPLKQGIKIGGDWHFTDYTHANMAWTQDLLQQNHLISVYIEHHLREKSNITLGAGGDFMVCKSTNGWVGQYYGDDRLRGWFSYAF